MRVPREKKYVRPVPCPRGLPGAWSLAGTVVGFREVEVLDRDTAPEVLPVEAALAVYPELREQIGHAGTPRAAFAGLPLGTPRVMGVVNVTPDSFSDGGLFADTARAVAHGLALAAAGADILDIGGESTRPGALPVQPEDEIARVVPVIEGLAAAGCAIPVSIDTRNAATALAALAAGATLLNDVSALGHDPAMAAVAPAAAGLCLMHAQGDPRTMQKDPRYDDVLLDVYDFLEERVAAAIAAGVPRERIAVDPGIGFGKRAGHNLDLLRGLSLFHGLGAALLLGVSRKRFIGTIGGAPEPRDRAPGSIAAGLAGLAQGVHILRVHNVAETVQAVRVWQAIAGDWQEDA
jgi:dihydropteroate synthase